MILRGFSALVRARRGNAAIELALLAPILTLMAVAIADYGAVTYRNMQVQHAAQAGAAYAMRNGFDTAAILAAVSNASTMPGLEALPAPSQSCFCANAAGTLTAAGCGAICPDGASAGQYVTVGAQAPYSMILPYPGIPETLTISATSIVRID